MFFNENKRKRLHNNRVQVPEDDWVGTQTWLPFLCSGAQTWWPLLCTYAGDTMMPPRDSAQTGEIKLHDVENARENEERYAVNPFTLKSATYRFYSV